MSEKDLSNSELIDLLGVFENELIHRNSHTDEMMFKFFVVSFVVTVLPYLDKHFGVTLPAINKYFFPILGIFLATLFYIIVNMYISRVIAISKTIQKLNEYLPNKYKRESISSRGIWSFCKIRISYVVPGLLYVFQLILASIEIYIFSING